MQFRVARHTRRLDELVAFYRDGVGLPEIGRFQNHAGYNGVFLEITGTGAHLEFTSGGIHDPPEPNPESLLVLYVGNRSAMREIEARLRASPVPPANPYWASALTFLDPDGFRVVIVPHRWDADGRTVAHRCARFCAGDCARPLRIKAGSRISMETREDDTGAGVPGLCP